LLRFHIPFDHAKGAHHDTHPTTNTFILIANHGAGIFIAMHGAGDAGLHTWRLFAVSALQGKGKISFLFKHQHGHGARDFFLERFHNLL
jgi:hypothetical protein